MGFDDDERFDEGEIHDGRIDETINDEGTRWGIRRVVEQR